jgi:NADH-quinone oxidoreductase subunit G
LSGDLREELPVLFLRLRDSVTKGRTSIVDLSPGSSSTAELAAVHLGARPGDALLISRALSGDVSSRTQLASHPEGRTFADGDLDRAAALIGADGQGVVVVLGRPSLAEDASIVEAAARHLHQQFPKATFLPALRRANVRGAIDMGLVPGMLPGRRTLADASPALRETWAVIPQSTGRSAVAQAESFVTGSSRCLVVLGAQAGDLPDAAIAARFGSAAGSLIVVAGHGGEMVTAATVVLPAAVAHERPGTTTNIEGRVSRLGQKVVAPGLAWPDWMIATELMAALGHDTGWSTVDDVTEEIAHVAPSHAGMTPAMLSRPGAADGLVAPLDGTMPTVAPLDPIATPGLTSPDEVGLGSRTGTLATDADGAGDVIAIQAPTSSLAADGDFDGPSVPSPDSYSLRLVATRTLYDDGAQVLAAPSLATLRRRAVARVNPYDLDRLGVTTGDEVRLRTTSGTLVLAVEAAPGTLRGTVAIDYNVSAEGTDVHGNAVASLIEPGSIVTDVRMESL